MMQNQLREIPTSKRYFPALLPIIGEEKYEQIYKRYGGLYQNHDLPKSSLLKWHLVEGILPGLALYQNLREGGESQENALVVIDRTFEKLFSDIRTKMKKLGNFPWIYNVLRMYIKSAMRQYPPEGWKLEWILNDKNAVRFNMNSCFYYDTLVHYGAPGLTISFCKVDNFIYGDMSRYVKWQRTMTIGRGDTHCDFCFAHA